jgi:putative nucleotidyltransferase with HDIG domain
MEQIIQNKDMSTIKSRLTEKLQNEPNLNFLKPLFKELPGLELYLVGGMVRDIIYKKPTSKDFDFIARKIDIATLIDKLRQYGDVDLVGRNFGVLKFTPTDSTLREAIDIALPRKEFALGTGGYRDFKAQADENLSIEEDLSRRDLTINAIAWDIKKQEIIDPFGGQDDLNNKCVRAVGKPEERLQEDYSRMLRAIRFACRFDFEIEEKTFNAIKKLMPKINDTRINSEGKKERVVPMETIGKEILKALKENPVRAVELLDDCGALKQIMPEVLTMKGVEQPTNFHSEGDVWTHAILILKNLEDKGFRQEFAHAHLKPEFVLCCLLHDIGKPTTFVSAEKSGDRIRFSNHDKVGADLARQICNRLKLSADQTKMIDFVIQKHMIPMMGKIDEMKNTTIEKTFMGKHGKELLMLIYLDSISTVKADGAVDLQNYRDIKERVHVLESLPNKKGAALLDLLTGDEIMKILKIKPGKDVGLAKTALREEQLAQRLSSKEQAIAWLKQNLCENKTSDSWS